MIAHAQSVYQFEVSRPSHSVDMIHFGGKLMRIIVRGMDNPTYLLILLFLRLFVLDLWANTCQTDHVTSSPWPLTLEVMALTVMRLFMLQLFTKFEVRKPSNWQIWHTFALSTSRVGDLDLWSFDLETGAHYCKWNEQTSCQFWCFWDFSFSIY